MSEGSFTAQATNIRLWLQARTRTATTFSWKPSFLPAGVLPPHIQTREEEGFYVTQGELVFRAAGRRVVATPGTFIHVPRGVPHSFKNESDEVARLVFFFVPAGIEEMFEKMAADPDRFVEIAGEYGVEFVDAA